MKVKERIVLLSAIKSNYVRYCLSLQLFSNTNSEIQKDVAIRHLKYIIVCSRISNRLTNRIRFRWASDSSVPGLILHTIKHLSLFAAGKLRGSKNL